MNGLDLEAELYCSGMSGGHCVQIKTINWSHAIAAETRSEWVGLIGSMFLLGSDSARCDRAACQTARDGRRRALVP